MFFFQQSNWKAYCLDLKKPTADLLLANPIMDIQAAVTS